MQNTNNYTIAFAKRQATQKIFLFAGIIACLLLAVNF